MIRYEQHPWREIGYCDAEFNARYNPRIKVTVKRTPSGAFAWAVSDVDTTYLKGTQLRRKDAVGAGRDALDGLIQNHASLVRS